MQDGHRLGRVTRLTNGQPQIRQRMEKLDCLNACDVDESEERFMLCTITIQEALPGTAWSVRKAPEAPDVHPAINLIFCQWLGGLSTSLLHGSNSHRKIDPKNAKRLKS